MTTQRRSFTPKFKREAASLVLAQGYSHIEAAHSLGLVESALRRWVSQLRVIARSGDFKYRAQRINRLFSTECDLQMLNS